MSRDMNEGCIRQVNTSRQVERRELSVVLYQEFKVKIRENILEMKGWRVKVFWKFHDQCRGVFLLLLLLLCSITS